MPADTMSSTLEQEIRTNRISIYACAIIGLASFLVGVITDSVTMMLDSSAWGAGVISSILYTHIIKTLDKSPDAKYNFGYSKYEPLVVTVEGLLILSACVLSVKFAIQDLVHPEDPSGYILMIVVTGITGIASLAIGLHTRRVSRKIRSPILASSGLSWCTDGLASLGLCAGFSIGETLARFGASRTMVHNIDPIMAIVLAIVLMLPPARMIRSNMLDLLDANPGAALEASVREFVERFRAEHGLGEVRRLRVRKAGRKVFLNLGFISDGTRTMREMDQIAHEFSSQAGRELGSVDVMVYFDT
ncbi:MAG: cation diffusion facilitator family transporter [candidate division NC10 bacterium]|nr:cation diffusion facilitator family transporter [candidate division NC10 bacterium]